MVWRNGLVVRASAPDRLVVRASAPDRLVVRASAPERSVRLNQQKPYFCEYLKNPNSKTYVNSHAAKKAIKTCKISIPKC
nr:non-specific lipid-transfer protein 2-like [Ipomoea trifida]